MTTAGRREAHRAPGLGDAAAAWPEDGRTTGARPKKEDEVNLVRKMEKLVSFW